MAEKTLEQFMDENSSFLTLEDGESAELVYTGKYRIIPNRFDIEKQTVEYELEDKEGRKKTWTNGTNRVAAQMMKIKEGEVIKITRAGEGQKTQYTIALVGEEK